ncbi:MAG TPA: GAF and ANTAR domain-containing protein [Arachnia sp.]|nr:GAF and ANTAR domain-containing protein [Arachnia sp.]
MSEQFADQSAVDASELDGFLTFAEVAAQFDQLADRLRATEKPLANALVEAAIEMAGAQWGTITVQDGDQFRSLVVSDDFSLRLDLLQYAFDTGPCLDAIRHDTPYMVADLRHEDRWPEYIASALSMGVRSIFAQPLHLMDQERTIASLNLYSDTEDAFRDRANTGEAAVVSTFASMGTSIALSQSKAEQLESALRTNREIAMAMGVLMGRHSISRDAAFNLMRLASHHSNLKMSAIADEIITTGELPMGRVRRGGAAATSPIRSAATSR